MNCGGGRRRLRQPGDGSPGLSDRGYEGRRKRPELRREYDLLRRGSV